MTLREKIRKLLEVTALPPEERKVLEFVVSTAQEGPLEDQMFPDVQSHVEGRFEWFFRPDGTLRRP